MKFLKRFLDFMGSVPNQPQPEIKKPQRRYIKDVRPGESIYIEWYRVQGRIAKVKYINNDPESKKILLQIHWNNYEKHNIPEYEKIILRYDDDKLENFNLLNKDNQESDDKENDYDIGTLQKKMNEALEKEEYETADELQKKIDKILNKK